MELRLNPCDPILTMCIARQAAGTCSLEPVAYEFFTQAFLLYEEEIAVSNSMGIFYTCSSFLDLGHSSMEFLITLAVIRGSSIFFVKFKQGFNLL